MKIFSYTDYRAFLRDHFRSLKNGGRGQLSKLASHLGVHSTFVSLVFKEKRELSPEQAMQVANYLQLSNSETDYFFQLVQLSRSGTPQLTEYIKSKIHSAQLEAKKLSTQYEHEHQLNPEERQTFYSSWHYSAIRIFTSTNPQGVVADEISKRLQLSRRTTAEAMDFLLKTKLVRQEASRYLVGPQRTFLEKGHPLLKCHHSNWRLKALQQYERLTDDELMFTTTLSLSRKDFARLREQLAEFVKTTSNTIKETDPEDIACVNLDLFWIR